MIPLPTTTISVLRLTSSDLVDPYTDAIDTGFSVIATGINARISSPSGREKVAGGEQSDIAFRLAADPCDLDHQDRVKDETTGEMFLVNWVYDRSNLPMGHVTAGLSKVSGLS